MKQIVLQIVCYFAVLASVAFRAECACKTMCTMLYAPVCGSDGKTYSNKCVLEAAACESKTDITVVHNGECETAADPGPSCNTMCTMQYAPVCGSDGTTYSNKCVLEAEACQTKKDITVAHDGECETAAAYSCDQVSCPAGKSCVLNDESRPECVCNEICNRIYRPVCGSDGKTYSNKCELEATACRNDEIITVSHNGQC